MTQDDIIEMARQAGMVYREFEDEFANANTDGVDLKTMTAFYKLVSAKEREAIKSLAEKELLNTAALMSIPPQSSAAWNILQAIQARGEA